MAPAQSSRPGRTLIIFFLVIAAMYAAVAAIGTWKPKLGLDLQGGQRITLQASTTTGGGITAAKLQEAVGIINDRINGVGVGEAEVSTQGSDVIVIEIPGTPDENQTRSLAETAQLRFRLVSIVAPATVAEQPTTPTEPSATSDSTETPGTETPGTETPGTETPGTEPTEGEPTKGRPSGDPKISNPTGPDPTSGEPTTGDGTGEQTPDEPKQTKKSTDRNRVVSPWMIDDTVAGQAPSSPAPSKPDRPGKPTKTQAPGTTGPSDQPTPATPTATAPTDSAPTDTAPTDTAPTVSAPVEPAAPTTTGGPPPELVPPVIENIEDPYAWIENPPQEWQDRLAAFDCDQPDPSQPGQVDIPSQPLLACDSDGNRYLLGPSMLDGTEVTDASSGLVQQGVDYAVDLEFSGKGADIFGDVTGRIASKLHPLTNQQEQLAIVLDAEVLSAPSNDEAITGGRAQITGGFTSTTAQSLANSLKYGALPLTFTKQDDTTVGPELAGDQLGAGIIAGIIGLVLVMIYCLVYYRGLGLVVIASLLIAGVITYASVLLLGKAYGFTLTLPGIAGLIVAVGITADSFIVYFERLRDEVRDGKTLRTSVETGWARARTTILAADAVSMLAALVLFIFAIGVVKGFAFALGLTTLIDVFVVFFFTKPMVTMLSRTKFFGQGHTWSGLDRRHLGMKPLARTARPARGEA